MPMTSANLIRLFESLQTSPYSNASLIPRFISLVSAEQRALFRDCLPGHLTASAFVADTTRTRGLVMHHTKLDKWLQPGGHADGDGNLLGVALKELLEETGVSQVNVLSPRPIQLDVHTIPAHKGVEAHLHFDVRFGFIAESDRLEGNEESLALAWLPLAELSANKVDESTLHGFQALQYCLQNLPEGTQWECANKLSAMGSQVPVHPSLVG